MANPLLRDLPRVDDLLRCEALSGLSARLPHALLVAAIRDEIDARRRALLDGAADAALVDPHAVAHAARRRIEQRLTPSLRPVINATGVVLHTNLGRAPLAPDVLRAMAEVASGYSNLEYDLAGRRRGSRYVHAADLLAEITGAEDSLVVNNNAAAMVLMLAGLAKDREVVVSRGELVEIGGSFRLPDILETSGARLKEVGTTNRTHLGDYERAIGPETAMLLKVHRSNFEVVGFTSEVSGAELAGLGRTTGVPACEDLGSGCVVDLTSFGIPTVTVLDRVAQGLDLVTFSADKLLGGPQAGILVGRADLIGRLRRHPLTRALRVDKLTLSALEGTLHAVLDGSWRERLPALAMLTADRAMLTDRAGRLAERLRPVVPSDWSLSVVPVEGQVGGGALPLVRLPGDAVRIAPPEGATAFEERLRKGQPPVVGRLAEDALLLDVRTIGEAQIEAVVRCVEAAAMTDDSG